MTYQVIAIISLLFSSFACSSVLPNMNVDDLVSAAMMRIASGSQDADLLQQLLLTVHHGPKMTKRMKKRVIEGTTDVTINGKTVTIPNMVLLKATRPVPETLPFDITVDKISDVYDMNSYPIMDALGCDELINDKLQYRWQPRCAIATDGVKLPLPRRIDYTSKVMAKDDLLEIQEMPVPFTSQQMLKAFEVIVNGGTLIFETVDDFRPLDFLGCDKIIDLAHLRTLTKEDCEIILQMNPCLEAKAEKLILSEDKTSWTYRHMKSPALRFANGVLYCDYICNNRRDVFIDTALGLGYKVVVCSAGPYISFSDMMYRKDVMYRIDQRQRLFCCVGIRLKYKMKCLNDGCYITVEDGVGLEIEPLDGQELPTQYDRELFETDCLALETIPLHEQYSRGWYDLYPEFHTSRIVKCKQLTCSKRQMAGRRVVKDGDKYVITWLHDT